jgi:hypothetical protein
MRDMRLKYFYKFFELFGINYWDTRYTFGGGSGYKRIDINIYSNYIWSAIEKTLGKPQDVIDVGCGDLLVWNNRNCDKYVGIDISSTIIERDKKLKPNWKFICSSADAPQALKTETAICLNTLFHIMDDKVYDGIINNLISWSNKWIVILTWGTKPDNIPKDSIYQKYRDFSIYKQKIIDSGFSLVLEENIPYDKCSYIWIFKKD